MIDIEYLSGIFIILHVQFTMQDPSGYFSMQAVRHIELSQAVSNLSVYTGVAW